MASRSKGKILRDKPLLSRLLRLLADLYRVQTVILGLLLAPPIAWLRWASFLAAVASRILNRVHPVVFSPRLPPHLGPHRLLRPGPALNARTLVPISSWQPQQICRSVSEAFHLTPPTDPAAHCSIYRTRHQSIPSLVS